MSEIKLIFCVVIGVLTANFLTYYGYSYLTATQSNELAKHLNVSKKNPTYENLNEDFENIKKPRISVTIKNDSNNQLTCGKMLRNQYISFLTLDGKKKRSYDNVEEGQFIGCQIRIDDRSSTILNWFYATSPGTYALTIEQVECKTCQGIDHTWATIVITPNGERTYRQTE
jgi:hypothetical protein